MSIRRRFAIARWRALLWLWVAVERRRRNAQERLIDAENR